MDKAIIIRVVVMGLSSYTILTIYRGLSGKLMGISYTATVTIKIILSCLFMIITVIIDLVFIIQFYPIGDVKSVGVLCIRSMGNSIVLGWVFVFK